MKLLKFNEISEDTVESKSGIYAWYYKVSLGTRDIIVLTESLKDKSFQEQSDLVRDFLDRHFYQYFKESDYSAVICGKLMPTFEGSLSHVNQGSESLVESIVKNPSSLLEIQRFITEISVDFSSPIYIGMADNLKSRLSVHKSLIDKFKSESFFNQSFECRDENFAARIVARKMLTKNLYVAVHYVDSDSKIHGMLENLMNRINYPVLGRN